MDQELSDDAIIAASRHEPDRFGLLYDRYCATLYRYAYRRLGPSGSAEDVVADAFVVAFRKRGGYDLSRSDARPWLFGILTREISKRHRAEEARYRALGRAGAGDDVEEFTDRVDSAVAAQAVRGALAVALSRIRPVERDVLLLIAWGDLSYEEVAQSLHIKIGTVRSRLHRARQQLRAALQDIERTP
ncbi:RNA polymerase sigma factor [Actinoplanes sp. NPDC051633]|uniref:RNA polymerase sigma factor n=1 Tax=Actinoplanes sp. NPDC051633 TaxID=3155670 RepID=UPI003415AC12